VIANITTKNVTTRLQDPSGDRWARLVALGTMLVTLIPYLIGASFANGRRYMWLGYNLDDSCVYLSWMRQAADGSLRAFNLFTTDPQKGMALNPLFLVLGRIAGWTHLPLLLVYHSARLLFGFGLIILVWKLIQQTISHPSARRTALLLVCFSSGLGWLPFWWEASPIETPIDKWQPEGITFLSLYLSPLFCFSMMLQVGVLLLLVQGERTGNIRFTVSAGLCGFLLGLVHAYDVITMSAVWLLYLIVNLLFRTRFASAATGLRTAIAGLITTPAVVYLYIQLRHETVFRERVNVPTPSASLRWVLLGYGLTLALAIAGAYRLVMNANCHTDSREALTAHAESQTSSKSATETTWTTGFDATLLLLCWAIANIGISYLPGVPFQRKLLQGAHIPIALLAGIGLTWLLSRTKLAGHARILRLATLLITIFLSLTNLFFIARDIGNYQANRAQTKQQRPYLQPGEIEALAWIAAHTPQNIAIQPLPWVQMIGEHSLYPDDMSLACFTPGLIHRNVYCGHWGETPDYPSKIRELARFGKLDEDKQRVLLRKMNVRYLIFSQKKPTDESADRLFPMFRGRLPLPNYLILSYSNADADVYEVVPP
jgi:hypothetical protein